MIYQILIAATFHLFALALKTHFYRETTISEYLEISKAPPSSISNFHPKSGHFLAPFIVPRPPDSENSKKIQQFLIYFFTDLIWNVTNSWQLVGTKVVSE